MATETLTCARHGEPTGLRCVTCDEPVCPRCLVHTDVGQRCEDCGRPVALPARAGAGRLRARLLVMAAGAALVVVAVAVVALRPSGDGGTGSDPTDQQLDIAGSWDEAPPLPEVRGSTTAVVLEDGSVLVAGGGVSAIPIAAAERFDPAAGTWTAAEPMAEARRGHQAVVLDDGRVLVAGGVSAAGALASAELFDPATGTWATAAPMATGRLGHSLTVLGDGRVLVAGGSALDAASGAGAVTPLATSEVYDPATGRWSPGPAMAAPRFEHTATRLAGGRVLVAGGLGAGGEPVASAELFDPAAGVFVAAAPLAGARTNHAAVELADHRVLVAGGAGGPRADTALRTAEIFDPDRNAWTRAPSLAKARTGATATTLTRGGTVLVAGGEAVDGGARRSLADAELFDPTAGRWRPAGAMACPRSEHSAAALHDGSVLVVAGDGAFPGQPPAAQGCADRFRPAAGGG